MFDSLQPLDCSPPGSSAMGILQTRILKLVTMPSCRVSSQSRTEPWSPALQADSLPCEPPGKPYHLVQLSSVTHRAQLLVTPWTAAHQPSLCFTISQSCSNSCPLSWWHNPTISSSAVTFSSYLQSFSVSGSFPMSWLFTSGGQSTGASVFSISPSNEYSGLISFRTDWFDFLAVQCTVKSLLQHHTSKASFFGAQPSWWSNFHIHT